MLGGRVSVVGKAEWDLGWGRPAQVKRIDITESRIMGMFFSH